MNKYKSNSIKSKYIPLKTAQNVNKLAILLIREAENFKN